MSTDKIKTIDEASSFARARQAAGHRVVFTNGCFDLLHAGHIKLFRKARAAGDALIVALNSDASVRRLKGADRPIFSQEERAEIAAAMESVDVVCIFDQDTPLEAILAIRPDILVKGADWSDKGIVGQSEVEGWGGKVVALDLVSGRSTTGIVERIRERA